MKLFLFPIVLCVTQTFWFFIILVVCLSVVGLVLAENPRKHVEEKFSLLTIFLLAKVVTAVFASSYLDFSFFPCKL